MMKFTFPSYYTFVNRIHFPFFPGQNCSLDHKHFVKVNKETLSKHDWTRRD